MALIRHYTMRTRTGARTGSACPIVGVRFCSSAPLPAARQGARGAGYSAASCRVPPSHAVTTSSATAPGGSALMPTSVQVG